MLKFFFQEIPQNLFEPIWATALAGMLIVLIWGKNCKISYGKTLIAVILFMCSWRTILHESMTGRYCSGLILPAILFSAIFCVEFPAAIKALFPPQKRAVLLTKKSWIFLQKYLWIILACIVIIPLIIKNMRIDHAGLYVHQIIKDYCDDKKNLDSCRTFIMKPEEQNRFAYYAGIFTEGKLEIIPEVENTEPPEKIFNRIKHHWNIPGTTYIFAFFPKGKAVQSFESENRNDVKITELSRYYTSRKKKQEAVLYKIESSGENIAEISGEKFSIPPGVENLFQNPLFEEEIKVNVLQQKVETEQKNDPDFSISPAIRLPRNWEFRINPLQFRLTDKNPLEGNFSLLSERGEKTAVLHSNFIYGQGKYLLSLVVKNTDDHRFLFSITPYCEDKDHTRSIFHTWTFSLDPDKTYRISCPLIMEQEDLVRFYITFQSTGYAMMDMMQIKKIKQPES